MKIIIDDNTPSDATAIDAIVATTENEGNIILDRGNNYLCINSTNDNRFDIEYVDYQKNKNLQTREYISREVFERVIRLYILGDLKWRKENIWEPVREKVPKHPWYVGWCVCILIILIVVTLVHVFKLNGTQRHDSGEIEMIRLRR